MFICITIVEKYESKKALVMSGWGELPKQTISGDRGHTRV